MKFKEFALYLKNLEKTSSRLKITEILAKLFKEAGADEIGDIVNLSLGQLAPSYESIVFNIADTMMVEVLANAYKKEKKEALSLYKKKGDLGDAAYEMAKEAKADLTVSQVYDSLKTIALDEGIGSVERKIKKTAELLTKLDPLSARFVARIPVGRLRLGFSDKTILDALSWFKKGDKSAKKQLEEIYNVRPDVAFLAEEVKKKGIEGVAKVDPKFGVPILPMLAQRLKSPVSMIEKMGEVAVEPKLDGLRLQLHIGGKETKAFTRNLNETSWMFPELSQAIKSLKAKKVILDVEAVGVDPEREKMANFQTTMTRRRKHAIADTATKVPIKFYCFDILLLNEKGLINESYKKRREILKKVLKSAKKDLFVLVDNEVTKDPERIRALNKEKKKEGLEGIMVKRTSARYVSGRTGWHWVKMKEAEKDAAKMVDTVDAIVMGFTAGKGKRVSFGVGQFLAGVKDGDTFKTITKVGTGLTDEQFKDLNERLQKIKVEKKPKEYKVNKILEPDFWVLPKQIAEIAADEITKSPSHTAGLALRFPRLIKFRDDKGPNETTTLSEIKRLAKIES